jgi:ribosomal protein L7/L12
VRDNEIRDEVASRLAAAHAALPTSVIRRPVRLVAGLARASTRWLVRTARRRSDIEAESAVAASLGELKGVTMKMGQLLGHTELGLPRRLTAALSALHTHAQPLALDELRGVLEADLGHAGRVLGARMHATPIAAGSLGQVHRAALPDGTPVAVKVLYPGIAATIGRDLWPATVTSRLATLLYRRAPLGVWVRDVRDRVREECDYRLEAERQQRFLARYAGHADLVVPAVHPAWSGARVLTTDLVEGRHLGAFLEAAPGAADKARAARALFGFFVGSLVHHGAYHCDPHPGNYLFLPDGRVALLDFGAVRELPPAAAERLARFIEPFLRDEEAAFTPLGAQRLDQVLARARQLEVAAELPFLLRMLFGLAATLGQLGARANWHRLLHGEPAAPVRVAEVVPIAVARQAPASEPGPVDVVLLHPGENVILVVRAIRDETALNLRDVKDLVDDCPRAIQRAVPRAAAERLRQRLERAGARVELRPAGEPDEAG